MAGGTRSPCVIVGCGQTKLGKLGRPLRDLVAEAVGAAMGDAGLPLESVKGLVAMPSVADLVEGGEGLALMPAHQMAMDLGMLTRPGGQDLICKTVDCGGASPIVALREACTLLEEDPSLGCVLVVGADAVGSMPTKEFLTRVGGSGDGAASAVIPTKYDDFARWHMKTFGTTRRELASVPTFMSLQALNNPNAFQSKKILDQDTVLGSGRVASNTNLFECAKRADGAAAVLVTTADFAADRHLLSRSVPVLGVGEASGALMPAARDIGVHLLPIHLACRRALTKANLSVREIDWFGLYDCFPVAFISALEQVGLCGYGEGGKWVAGAIDKLRRGGKVNVNTHGGLLGGGAPWEAPAMFTLIEGVNQVLGRCDGGRQIGGVRRALVQANGGTFSHEAVAVLGSPSELLAARTAAHLGRGGNVGGDSTTAGPFTTALTAMLGVKHPIMSAGMGGVAKARLAAAVSEAGGMGCIGAASMSVEDIRREAARVRELTGKPFAINLLALDDGLDEKAKAIATSGARAFVTGLGVAESAVRLMHANDVLVGVVCGQVKHAVAAVRAGCDFIIAQGTEGGGHTGNAALFTLLPQVRAAVPADVPVVAAGGVHDGSSLVAALSLGAAGVWIGTRFLASYEANTVKGYKERLLPATSRDVTITRYYTGKPCRVLGNTKTKVFEASGQQPAAFPQQFAKSVADGNNHLLDHDNHLRDGTAEEFMPAGQVVGAIGHILPAGQIVHSIVAQATQALASLQKFAPQQAKL